MEVLDFADFDRKFELKINEASEDLIAKKEQGTKSDLTKNGLSSARLWILLWWRNSKKRNCYFKFTYNSKLKSNWLHQLGGFHLHEIFGVDLLHLHHHCTKASNIDIPILAVCRKFVTMNMVKWLSLLRVSKSSLVERSKYWLEFAGLTPIEVLFLRVSLPFIEENNLSTF